MAKTNSSGGETSMKQLFQSMIPDGDEIMEGTVTQTNPLKIQITNDPKLIINERITIVPWHLTDYVTKATYTIPPKGSIESVDTDGGLLTTFTLTLGKITVHNALRKGDKLHILSLNHGKLFYVLDRVAGQEVL